MMSDKKMASVLKNGIGAFKPRRAEHEDELLQRIFAEVDFAYELEDDELEFLAAAGDVDAMLGERLKNSD